MAEELKLRKKLLKMESVKLKPKKKNILGTALQSLKQTPKGLGKQMIKTAKDIGLPLSAGLGKLKSALEKKKKKSPQWKPGSTMSQHNIAIKKALNE